MHSTTDYIVFGLLLFYFFRGYSLGLLRTLLGPISLFLGTVASFIYYIKTSNVLISLVIGIVGPVAINILLSLILKFSKKISPDQKSFFSLRRLLAGLINASWYGAIIAITLVLLVIIPYPVKWFQRTQDDIVSSISYRVLYQLFPKNMITAKKQIDMSLKLLHDPSVAEKIENTQEYRDFIDNKK